MDIIEIEKEAEPTYQATTNLLLAFRMSQNQMFSKRKPKNARDAKNRIAQKKQVAKRIKERAWSAAEETEDEALKTALLSIANQPEYNYNAIFKTMEKCQAGLNQMLEKGKLEC